MVPTTSPPGGAFPSQQGPELAVDAARKVTLRIYLASSQSPRGRFSPLYFRAKRLTCARISSESFSLVGIRYQAFAPPRRLEDTSEEFIGNQIGIKKGVWGESGLDFESIVEEVRRFVARMPPADSTTGLACCLRSFSALGDQRAEILPVQGPPTLAVGERYMMRLTRILIFPFFLSASWISCP
jgi:hypothetical protein